MTIKAILFDLDDTLVHDQAGYRAAAIDAWQHVAGIEVDHDELFRELRRVSRARWEESPAREYCRGVGLFPLAGLVTAYPGESEPLLALRQWSAEYRSDVWRKVLGRLGGPKKAATEIGSEFASRTLSGARALDGALELLDALKHYRLGIVTNGAVDLQSAKIEASGLARHFEVVAISTVIGSGKPDSRIFSHVMEALEVGAAECVVVGDNKVNDIEGGLAAGMQAIWFQPDAERWAEAPEGASVVGSLADVTGAITRLDG